MKREGLADSNACGKQSKVEPIIVLHTVRMNATLPWTCPAEMQRNAMNDSYPQVEHAFVGQMMLFVNPGSTKI